MPTTQNISPKNHGGISSHYVHPYNNILVPKPNDHEKNIGKSWHPKEEYEVEREIIKMILNGNTYLLKLNCRNGITVSKHCICVFLYEQNNPKF